ncbi:arginase [Pyrococcus furiosus DSM 3638]|uniref:Metal-binding protein n=3 Tax=Pyrococcus furiosus TaxID=2261 RepID=Q8U3G8_PYRFU|nr:arginase family protein [Pyrococcus furiosus]AAL80623.1 metal-binding protein [Pyrococcus furiosus DSM 3638]AFN03294.1 arginase [Pyrococcus furiosus COM1]QEK78212.1 arginase [Pyrococcus furiosus DSM 3638]
MTVFILNGEEPNQEGVRYVAKLLKREKLVEDIHFSTIDEIPLDNSYVLGDHSGTYFILKKIKPNALISLDAHTDLMQDYFDHASWLAYALKDNIIKRASVIGAVLMIPTTSGTKLWKRGVKVFPALPRTKKIRGKWKAYTNLEQHGVERVLKETREFLGKEIYLSIDLDVLSPEYRIARFQHGELTLRELLDIIEAIKKNFKIIAFDVAEISFRVAKSKYGRRAIIEVFSSLKEVFE